jgi:ABC-2 type transport system permease protein
MNAPPGLVPDAGSNAPLPAAPTRPLYWSLRRELWEHRSIVLAPIAVAAVVLLGILLGNFGLPGRMRELPGLPDVKQHARIVMPYYVLTGLVVGTAFVVGVFYCLEALHGERRDRSILFWKSLPVSDLTTVLAKAGIPLLVLPLLVLAIVVPGHLVILLQSTTILLLSGTSAEPLWTRLPLLPMWLALLYALGALALWHAPLYAWLLLVSAWARRAPFLWAVLPLLAIAVFEAVTFRTPVFVSFLKDRVVGWFHLAFADGPQEGASSDILSQLTPGRYLASPSLWIGLAFAASFLVAAARLRRKREPN